MPYVWEMIKEAAFHSDNTVITYAEIQEYIANHYSNVNKSTIIAQIIACSVNHATRPYYNNQKPRLCNTPHDFLYNVGRGQVMLYSPEKHGQWAIVKNADGVAEVKKIDKAGSNEEALLIHFATQTAPSMRPVQRKPRNGPTIPAPCESEVVRYLDEWKGLENYVLQEHALNKLFLNTYPENKNIDDVLIKVSALNDFYSTNIFSVFAVAKHIISLRIDERLAQDDEALVNDLALVEVAPGKTKNFYSFATKYCSHHRPDAYPIYDSYVANTLRHFRDVDAFFSFRNDELKFFSAFKKILMQFRSYYGLNDYSLKSIDRYLWLLGKEYLPKNYGSRKPQL